MSYYTRAIVDLRRKIQIQDADITELKRKIGVEISQLKPEQVKKTALNDDYEKAAELRKNIPQKSRIIQDIRKIQEKIDELDKKISGHRELILENEKEYKQIYENIGKLAFSTFKMNRGRLKAYENIFAELLRTDAKAEQINESISPEDGENRHVLRQFMDTARIMYLNQKQKIVLMRFPGLYRQAGKAVLTSDYIMDASSKELEEAVQPLLENEKVILQLQNEIKEYENEKDNFLEKFAVFEVKGKPERKIRELETEIGNIEKMIKEHQVNMGSIFIDHNLFQTPDFEYLADFAAKISDLKKANRECVEEIKRYETLIEIDRLDHKIDKISNKIENIKAQLAKQEKEMKALQREAVRMEKQKKVLEKSLGRGENSLTTAKAEKAPKNSGE